MDDLRLDTRYCPVCLVRLPEARWRGRASFCRDCYEERRRRANLLSVHKARDAERKRRLRAEARSAQRDGVNDGEAADPR